MFPFQLCAGEDDTRTMLGILFQNLSEGVTSSQAGKRFIFEIELLSLMWNRSKTV